MRKLLIANRGEIARRIQRTAREMGIATVAVFSEPDRDAPFVREADEAVALGGASPAESYLRIEAIMDAARRTGADAVHPGYGFLSENAALAAACRDGELTFVGPPPEVVAAMGSKLEAKRRMQHAGVPQLPSRELRDGASAAELARLAGELGLPVVVKASAGGGGRGMRVVHSAAELGEAVASARREALSAFGDDTVYLERYLEAARHIEVQIFGDAHGRVIHLYERECSIQRRHQKIIEESPSTAITPVLSQKIRAAAVAAGEAIGYRNAGTVEFLLTPAGEFFFLEVNTRLQVEHPVTECVTGLDLVRLQIEVARGGALPAQEEVPTPRGHAIEARLYAEDPRSGFAPSTGTFHRFAFTLGSGLRLDSGVEDGSEVSVHYDPMLAKVIAWAPTRAEAAAKLANTLARAHLHGPHTIRDLLVRILRHPEFIAGATDTHFLQRHPRSDPRRAAVRRGGRAPPRAGCDACVASRAARARRLDGLDPVGLAQRPFARPGAGLRGSLRATRRALPLRARGSQRSSERRRARRCSRTRVRRRRSRSRSQRCTLSLCGAYGR